MIQHRQSILFVGDMLILIFSFILMILLRFNYTFQKELIFTHIKTFSLLFILWLIVFFIFDLYNLRRVNPTTRTIGLLLAAMIVNGGISIIAFYLFSPLGVSPKTNLMIIASSSFILLTLWRRVFYTLFTSRFIQRIALIGTGRHIEALNKELTLHPHIGSVVARWDTFTLVDINESQLDLIISEPMNAKNFLLLSIYLKTETQVLPTAYQTLFAKLPVDLMTNEKALSIVTKETHTGIKILYRIIESSIAIGILILMLPFTLLAAIAILIEDGKPIFINQKRVGKNGTIFSIWKLRSMKALAKDGSAETHGAQWAQQHDIRITHVGRIIRKLHLDEIPQMWNIIWGDLALVGPRPERPEIVADLEKEIPYYFIRHAVKPGFTGWAQIKFRYARTVLEAQEKFEYDLYYLLNKNAILDIGIVLKTIQIIFTH